ICMPCHAASFSVRNTVTIVALVIFAIGIINLVLVWAGAAFIRGKAEPGGRSFAWVLSALRTVFSVKLLLIVRALFLETLLNRRLWRQSSVRWTIHSLIFLPFVFRFTWGIIALVFSEAAGRWSVTRIMLDQNHAITAFLFDLTGIMVIAGVVLAILRRALARTGKVPGLPRPDWIALGLMGVLVINGFFLEGMRIAMTGGSEGAGFAFVGKAVSRLMAGASGLTTPYVILWNIHAVLTGAFVAYLPFSRMLHIIMAPVSLAINAVSEYEKRAFKVKEEE
ncbi:MAG: respiratory nitrate reductase subunit gamma, partial [Deltaproteobacteria bacterium]|nr:respiratory nitrate reductase subunit gamma [Deltaproteobacteria bacterium]